MPYSEKLATKSVAVKICGINDDQAFRATVKAQADYMGFVLFPPSPRHITPELAAKFVRQVPQGIKSVVLTVAADNELIDIIGRQIRPDYIQAHGKEDPARIQEISARSGIPVIKVLPIAGSADLDAVADFENVADMFLFDAKPPKGANRPGGLGQAFDWKIMGGYKCSRPWLLAGGLNADNVAQAINISGTKAVDVSSGVESQSGVKDPDQIFKFTDAVRNASLAPEAKLSGHLPAS